MSSIAKASSPPSFPRRLYYLDPEVQLPLAAALTLLATAESFFVGYGFYRAIEISREWQRPRQTLDFFGTLLLVIVPTVMFNLAAGIFISHRIAGPAEKIRRAMDEVAHGNLDCRVSLRRSDLLQSLAGGFNAMAASLRSALDGRASRRPRARARALIGSPRRLT